MSICVSLMEREVGLDDSLNIIEKTANSSRKIEM
jgi:hypothetical protein